MNPSGDSWGRLLREYKGSAPMVSTKMGLLHQPHPKRMGGFGRGYVMISLVKITAQKNKTAKTCENWHQKNEIMLNVQPFFLATTENSPSSFWENHVAKQKKAWELLSPNSKMSWGIHPSNGCFSNVRWFFFGGTSTISLRIHQASIKWRSSQA